MVEVIAKVRFNGTRKTYDYFIPQESMTDPMFKSLKSGWNNAKGTRAVVNVHGEIEQVEVVAIGKEFDVKHWATRELVELIVSNCSSHKKHDNPKTKKDPKVNDKGDYKMKNSLFGKFGEKVEGVFAFSVFDGSPAYKMSGKWVTYKDGGLVDANEFIMEMDVPGFIMPATLDQINQGDLISSGGELSIVTNAKDKRIETIDGEGNIKTISPVTNQMLGISYVLKVFNPISNGMENSEQGMISGGMNPMMLMMMGNNKGESNDLFKNMMMMQMFSGQQGMFPMGGAKVTSQ